MTDNWRDLGDTTLEQFVAEFEEYDSPLLAEAPAIYAAVKGHSKLALAKLWKEQKHGTWNQTIPRDYKNPFSQTRPGASSNDGVNRWQRFSTYEQAAAYWKDRVTSPTGPYKDTVTLEDLVHVYAPDYDNNNEKEYVRQLRERMAAMPDSTEPSSMRKLKAVQMVGCPNPVLIPEEVEFLIQIIPKGQTNQRPGNILWGGGASYYTQHETGNRNYGTGAQNHSNYMHMGAPDQDGNSQQLGYHLTIDDKTLIQMIPLNEVAWHAGDSGGPGNMDSIACELCVNVDSDRAKSREFAAIVAAGVMNAVDIPQVVQHNHWSGKNCPTIIREINYWPTYLSLVSTYRKAVGDPGPVYAPADTAILDKLGEYTGLDKVVDGTTFYACQRTLTARTVTRRLQFASAGAPSIGPDLKKGDLAPILYVFQAKKGASRYALTQYGTRLKLSHLTPYVVFTTPKEGP
jgi:N-acetylmuramoyl-L-alanine amidase